MRIRRAALAIWLGLAGSACAGRPAPAPVQPLALAPDTSWVARSALTPALRALFGEVGRVYAPFLLANAEALAQRKERVECTIDGKPWVQQPFPYQGKCLQWLREGFAALASGDRAAVNAVLEGTGCEALFG